MVEKLVNGKMIYSFMINNMLIKLSEIRTQGEDIAQFVDSEILVEGKAIEDKEIYKPKKTTMA